MHDADSAGENGGAFLGLASVVREFIHLRVFAPVGPCKGEQ